MNPFDQDQEESIADQLSLLIGDTINVFGIRDTPTTIQISKKGSFSPSRDAQLIATLLLTSLDPITLTTTVQLLYSKLSKQINLLEEAGDLDLEEAKTALQTKKIPRKTNPPRKEQT
jgi:hypothetical protein